MNTVHFTEKHFITPYNPITVNVIGAGGTGSCVITQLARINKALFDLGHPGLQVRLWDSDTVSTANLGRQLFAEAEIGLNKAVVLINRINRFFGTNWKATPKRFDALTATTKHREANITITCVDTVSARLEVAGILKEIIRNRSHYQHNRDQAYYWMDFGNSKDTGQVLLSTVGEIKQPESEAYKTVSSMPFITDEYGDLLRASEADDDTPSCSVQEALLKQDLFINSTLANMGCKLLWNLFRQGKIEHRGFFLNLAEFRSTPVKVQ